MPIKFLPPAPPMAPDVHALPVDAINEMQIEIADAKAAAKAAHSQLISGEPDTKSASSRRVNMALPLPLYVAAENLAVARGLSIAGFIRMLLWREIDRIKPETE